MVREFHGRSQVLALLMMMSMLSGCGEFTPPGPTTYSWTEDVNVEEQRTIRVQRSVSINETNSSSGDAYNTVETSATIAFTGELAQLLPWSEPLMAIVLYHDEAMAEWTVVATTTSCDVWRKRGAPRPPYWEYRLRAGTWQQVSLSPASVGRKANVTWAYKNAARGGHVDAEVRRQSNADALPARMYREVFGDPDQYVCGQGDSNKIL